MRKLSEAVYRSPKWMQRFTDFEFRTGEDIKGEPSEKQKEKIRIQQERERIEREERDSHYRIEKERQERQERERRERDYKQKEEREQQRIEREIDDLFKLIVRDFQNNPYYDKYDTPIIDGVTAFKYRFENGHTFQKVGNKITYIDGTYQRNYKVRLFWSNRFTNLANEIINKGKRRPTNTYSDKSKQSYKSEPHKETPKTGNPQKDKYNLLKDKIKLREERRVALENELNAYKRVCDKLKKDYKFEKLNMKHLKLFESFQNELTEEQSEDLDEIFFEFVKNKKMNYEEAQKYFTPGTQNFANFLKVLEDETDWFDYTQMDSIFLELSDLLIEYERIEIEEVEFEEAESLEIEEGDYVDFGEGFGKLYVIAILDNGYLVNKDEDQRWLGEEGDGFIITWTKIKDYNIIEKGLSGDDYFDDED